VLPSAYTPFEMILLQQLFRSNPVICDLKLNLFSKLRN
jgi:hypothetical protein